ncbi:MAG: glycosyltransferase family 2 protein [Candidatus Odinarchaeota archaeon]
MNVNRKPLNNNINLDRSVLAYNEYNGHITNKHYHDGPLVSVIIPLYNEENSIKKVIEKIPTNFNYEILIIDDGSFDNSFNEIRKIDNKYIRIIKHKRNLGYGAALLTGFRYAYGDFIVTIDSDGQHDPKEIPKLLKPVMEEKADLTIGSRYLGKCSYVVPLHVRMGEYFIRKVIKFLYHKEIANNQCGFRAFNKAVLNHLQEFYHYGMSFSTELLLKVLENNKKIMQVPISLKPRKYGTSYVNLARILRKICMCFLIYGLRKLRFSRKFIDKYLSGLFKKL